jgi:hypothetical protein
MNKKGAEMTIGTIIVIILALVVLVVIIYGFTVGWGNLWQKITGFSPKANVQTHVQACQIACTTESISDYCKDRNVLFSDNQKTPEVLNCINLVLRNVGLEPCPAITDCEGVGGAKGKTCANWGSGFWDDSCTESMVEVPSKIILASDKNLAANKNKKCCTTKGSCGSLSGTWTSSACNSNQYDVTTIVNIDTDENKDQKCCVNA